MYLVTCCINKNSLTFHIIRLIHKVSIPGRGVYTLAMYQRSNSIGIFVARCENSTDSTDIDPFWGCIRIAASSYKNKLIPSVEELRNSTMSCQAKLAALPKPLEPEVSAKISLSDRIGYSKDYLSHFNRYLDSVMAQPASFFRTVPQ